MTRYGMVFDVTKCIGCSNCVFACKDEYVGNDYPPYSLAQPAPQYGFGPVDFPSTPSPKLTPWVISGQSWIVTEKMVLGTFPSLLGAWVQEPCMMCDNPPCAAASSDGAVYTRDDGIVIIDPSSSEGQQNLVAACPYGRIYWNSTLNIPQKCTFCAHIIDAGGVPRCAQACGLGVITFGDLDDPKSAVSQLAAVAQPLHPEYGTKPKVYYIGLPQPFLKGTVLNGTTNKCLQGATVSLAASGQTILPATTNFLGEFMLMNVKTGVTYTLTISASGHTTQTKTITFTQATDIGVITL